MLIRFLTAAALTVTLASSAAAQSRVGPERMTVTPTGANSFVVSGQTNFWARGYWCAAGEYALLTLGLPVTARLYVSEPYRKGSRDIGFSTSSAGLSAQTLFTLGETIRTSGATLSVGQARGYCSDLRTSPSSR